MMSNDAEVNFSSMFTSKESSQTPTKKLEKTIMASNLVLVVALFIRVSKKLIR